ncbi:MAG: neutral/alkaline non-lysosomal ceramidase N-terminal domain-containing protein [Segetibacter sp.]
MLRDIALRLANPYYFLFIGCLVTITGFAGDLKIGAAAVKITPPIGASMAGYYYERGVEKIHDDLYAKALVIDKDGSKIAIVSCDLIGISANIVAEVRRLVAKSTGLDAAHVMIGATHSHTGPVIPSFRESYITQTKTAQILAGYIAKLPSLIAESIQRANAALKPAKISFGLGHEETISFNRRYFMTDGTVGWNPGKLNSKIVKPAGPIDPDVSVLYAETIDGIPISTYVNLALHLDTVSGTEVSADLPFTLSSILGKLKGSEMVTAFSQGCSGNINHVNVKTATPQSGHFEAERLGTILAGEVLKTYTRLSVLDVDTINVKSEIVQLPLAEISKDELPWAREVAAKYGKQNAAPFLDFVKAFKILEIDSRKGKPLDAEIQVFTLGDKFAIVSLPGEVFTEIGQYIRSRSPYPYTITTELTNAALGYFPDRKAYVEGNYEVITSRVAPGSAEILAENALRMLHQIKNK